MGWIVRLSAARSDISELLSDNRQVLAIWLILFNFLEVFQEGITSFETLPTNLTVESALFFDFLPPVNLIWLLNSRWQGVNLLVKLLDRF